MSIVKKQTIHSFCKKAEGEFGLIPKERKEKLLILSKYIQKKYEAKITPKIVVICTHNSRRSHMGQLCLAIGADYYQLPKIHTYSGGTEATAFNIRAVDAFRRMGVEVIADDTSKVNPIYKIKWKKDMPPYTAFSKKYEDAPNPSKDFAAIMVCTEADAGCPMVPGCDYRLSLPYEDPKAYDDTPQEEEKYSERLQQIGREMLFVLSQINKEA